MSALPDPLVPTDCDCCGLPFMPLETVRLKDSDLVALTTGDEFKAAVLLWCASWVETPSSSLPDDDRILAKKAGYSLAEWRGLREMALHNWIKCSDGRLYHPVIADLALAAWSKRKGQSTRATGRWAAAKAAKNAAAMPRHQEVGATVPDPDAPAMQVKEQVEVKEISDANASSVGAASPTPTIPRPDEVSTAFEEWNSLAERLGLPKARRLDANRRKAIRTRLTDGGLPAWRQALSAVAASPLCRGDNDRGWRADLDFICQAKSWRKLLEGSYAPPSQTGPPALAVVDEDFTARQLARLQAIQ